METSKVIEQPYFHEKGKMLTEKIEIGKSIFDGYISCTQYTPMGGVIRGNLLIHESIAKEVALAICDELNDEHSALLDLHHIDSEEIKELKEENQHLINELFQRDIDPEKIGIYKKIHNETLELIESYNSVDYPTREIKIRCAIESLQRTINRGSKTYGYNYQLTLAKHVLKNLTENRETYLKNYD